MPRRTTWSGASSAGLRHQFEQRVAGVAVDDVVAHRREFFRERHAGEVVCEFARGRRAELALRQAAQRYALTFLLFLGTPPQQVGLPDLYATKADFGDLRARYG